MDFAPSGFRRRKAGAGESGEVTIRMLLEVGLKLLPPIAVLYGIPESAIASFRSGLLRCPCRGICGRKRGCIKPCSGKRGKGAVRILLDAGFQFSRTAVLDTVPKRQLEGDLVVGGQFADRRWSGWRFGRLGERHLLRGRYLTAAEATRPDRMRDVLDQLLAEILEDQTAAMTQMILNAPRNADFAALDQPLEPSGYVDPISKDVIILDHHVADIDADPKAHPAIFRLVLIGSLESRLNLDRAANRVEHAGEFGEDAIAGGVRNPAPMLRDEFVNHGAAGGQRGHCRFFVAVHQPAVALDIGGEDCSKPAFQRRSLHLTTPTLP